MTPFHILSFAWCLLYTSESLKAWGLVGAGKFCGDIGLTIIKQVQV